MEKVQQQLEQQQVPPTSHSYEASIRAESIDEQTIRLLLMKLPTSKLIRRFE